MATTKRNYKPIDPALLDDAEDNGLEPLEISPELIEEMRAVTEPKKPAPAYGDKRRYEEWMVEVRDGKPVKIKKERDNVLINEETADTLNTSVLSMPLDNNNRFPVMYFLAAGE